MTYEPYKIKEKITIFSLIIIILLAAASQSSALEMSSKRDCVVCHIMWLDDFRTDRETLVEFQPGNVLMRDTQGVVSSEKICFSCHDGYVKDSRHITWKYNRHPVFVKPSDNISVPPELPLSVRGEIYCGTCHSAHGQGAAPTDYDEGRTAVYREVNIDSGLCEKCHRNEAEFKRTKSHPLHKGSLELPEKLFDLGSTEASHKNEVICQSCHDVHGARGEKILIMDNKYSQLCITCHKDKESLVGTKHDLRVTMPDERNIKDQPLTESGPCGACHTPHKAVTQKLWARPLKEGNPATELCLSCHGDDRPYKIKGIGRFSHPINAELSPKESRPENIPLFAPDGSKTEDGRVQCFTCHDIHRWDPLSLENRGGKDVEGSASDSFLRMTNISSELCLECHTDKSRLIRSDHNLAVTAPEEKNIQGFKPAVSGPCGVCHVPHNANAKRLWAKELSGEQDFVTQLCTACHNENGAAKTKLLGEIYHPVNVTLKKFNIETTLPLFSPEGSVSEEGRVVCITCHEPHVWDPDEPVSDYEYKNMEGNAGNSFLRKSNSPSSDLCKTCHEDKAYVDGTDHDLIITGPDAKNLLGQTPAESGQCGVCHLVHNGVNEIKLWARPYGKIGQNEDIVDALCNSCHSEGNPGEAKIPMIATHPDERLVNNVMRNDRTRLDYAPIFDKETGKETNVGNISCPTCHNAHQWSPLHKDKGSYKNLEGNATNSFLRNVSYNNICIDCHGMDALFRYKYYHDPAERVEPDTGSIRNFDRTIR